jgi:hypothetical protein
MWLPIFVFHLGRPVRISKNKFCWIAICEVAAMHFTVGDIIGCPNHISGSAMYGIR